MAPPSTPWRTLDGVPTAWFGAPSLVAGAAAAAAVTGSRPEAVVDVRATGVRVRLPDGPDDGSVSDAVRGAGLEPDPSVLQQVRVVWETADTGALVAFWSGVLGYDVAADVLRDPLRRDPDLLLRPATEHRPLRGRLHLDVVRPTAVVERVRPGSPAGPYAVRHADPDGNEVDLVAGDPLGDDPATADWCTVFSAIACYRVRSTAQQQDLAGNVARLAHEAGFPLQVDLRPGLVVLDSGKDRWEADAHGLPLDFVDLAAGLQTTARGSGAAVEPDLPRFAQLFLDAVDVVAVRAFWQAALRYEPDRREGVTDLHDPRGLGPTLVLQDMDPAETDRRRQRDRGHVELLVPAEAAEARVRAALESGGRLLAQGDGRRLVADPEGNELAVVEEP
ncbi:VOC family protein [Aquipuribacter sp. SD81]|uniref:VOC family protein n=1 Tax=Aquipuribacter sp. SD81 TaxID=3127703 RepID=UPI0030170C35